MSLEVSLVEKRVCVYLNVNNPPDCNVEPEDECAWPLAQKNVQYAGVSKESFKMIHLKKHFKEIFTNLQTFTGYI